MLLLCLGVVGFAYRGPLTQRLFEYQFNQATPDIFHGSVHVNEANIDRYLQIHIQDIEGTLTSKSGLVPVSIKAIHSEGSLLGIFLNDPILFHIQEIKLNDSKEKGLHGTLLYQGGKNSVLDFTGEIDSIELEDLTWLDPEHLRGASGKLSGHVYLKVPADMVKSQFELTLAAKKPGGSVQAQFFDLLTPYLPSAQVRVQLKKMDTAGNRVVSYSHAALQLKLIRTDKVKGLLQMMVKDYNLDLNLNFEIRVDKENPFAELGQLVGIMEGKVSK